MDRPIIGITLGDPAGIGPEICAKALTSQEIQSVARCVVIGDSGVMRQGLQIAKIKGIELHPIAAINAALFKPKTIDIFDLNNVDLPKLKLGQISKPAGKAAFEYINKAIDLALDHQIDAITTGPINKEALHKAGFRFDGHTEILAARTKTKKYAMMFVSEKLWLMLATTHIPLNAVSRHLKKKKLVAQIKMAHDFMLADRGRKPRIGVAGLNPHAGENGIFGKEELKIIKPAVEEAKKMGIDVEGPISPDAIFFLANSGKYDLVIAMYHDQGLIPLKLLSFNHSVNITIGLPIIRTSVDHGTGFNIAGKGWASPDSLIAAIKVAAHFAQHK